MTDLKIRLMSREGPGVLADMQEEFGLEDFGGIIPQAGDVIIDPGVVQGRDRRNYENRTVWEVERRAFQTRDNGGNYVVLIVAVRPADMTDEELI